MFTLGRYEFKRAARASELEQIHRLNHRTFVEEIPQHAPGDGRQLIDKFHAKNVYFVALEAGRVVGMVSCHDQPPFSVADRLADDAPLRAAGRRPLEIRLLAVEADRRHSLVFGGLLWSLYEYIVERGYTHLFISGVVERGTIPQSGISAAGPAGRTGDRAVRADGRQRGRAGPTPESGDRALAEPSRPIGAAPAGAAAARPGAGESGSAEGLRRTAAVSPRRGLSGTTGRCSPAVGATRGCPRSGDFSRRRNAGQRRGRGHARRAAAAPPTA